MSRPSIICVMPVKNEEWVLELSLAAASTWADRIVVADQNSTDRSVEIARSFEKVEVVTNDTDGLDEGARQQILLTAARKYPGPRLIVALDADELLSAQAADLSRWDDALSAGPGTVIKFRLANLLDAGRTFWYEHMATHFPVALVDDGRPSLPGAIHTPRVPVCPDDPELLHEEISVLHLQYIDWERMKRKQRWYQCWERIHHPDRRPLKIFRQYHHMDAARRGPVDTVPGEWLGAYEQRGIRVDSIQAPDRGWWDEDVVRWIEEYGADYFKRLDIWDLSASGKRLSDPRSPAEKAVMWWLRRTQGKTDSDFVKRTEEALERRGW